MISGESIMSGTLEIDGPVLNDLEPKERSIAMVFQTYAIFPPQRRPRRHGDPRPPALYLHPAGHAAGKPRGTVNITERVVEAKLRAGRPLIAALSEDRFYNTGTRIGFDFDPGRAQLVSVEI
jgi:hypothetical protein